MNEKEANCFVHGWRGEYVMSGGSVYVYLRDTGLFTKIHTAGGKVGGLFAVAHHQPNTKGVIVLVTVTGQDVAELLIVLYGYPCTFVAEPDMLFLGLF